MKNLVLPLLLAAGCTLVLEAEDRKKDEDAITQQHVKEQLELEKKYAKEQEFYNAEDYNFSAVEVDEKSLSKIPKIEPDFDFNMDDVYSDE
ncbi:MAG: hypothetical protein B6D59_01895 [Campylobacteraceae bacterium 4484_4]|nr:MAG: hypothetical protein B6D59_01895 [Campylobacteraceae bacterium 4484_4]